MEAVLHDITARFKEMEVMFPTKGDFTLAPGSGVSARLALEQEGWTPYCLDPDGEAMIFVRLPGDIDLGAAPFFYITQFHKAVQVLSVPLADLPALTADLPDPELILVFSIGRCGTTLVSHVLNGAPGVWSISEPGIFDHKALDSVPAAGSDRDLYIRSVTRLLAAAAPAGRRGTLAVKFRSQALFRTGMFFSARPDARYVFMYRDALKWGDSFLQFLANLNLPIPFDAETRDFNWMIMSADAPIEDMARFIDLDELPIHPAPILAAGWVYHLTHYLEQFAAGVPFLALRYDELVTDREAQVSRLFSHCALPQSAIAGALGAFDEDSQKGTSIERKQQPLRFDAEQIARFRATLAKSPALADPGTILPDIHTGNA